MMNTNAVLQAFESSAGVSADEVSLLLRSIILVVFLLWAVWSIHGHFQLMQNGAMDIYDFPAKILRVLVLCALMMTVVYVS